MIIQFIFKTQTLHLVKEFNIHIHTKINFIIPNSLHHNPTFKSFSNFITTIIQKAKIP